MRATGLWRPLNYSSQTDDWLLIHPFFWKEGLIIIPISTRPMRSCKAKQLRFLCLLLHRLVKLKGSASDTLRMALQKQRKKMNYVRSLWILHCRGGCPTCPPFPSSDKTWIGVCSHWHNTAELYSPRLFFKFPVITVSGVQAPPVGFLGEKL